MLYLLLALAPAPAVSTVIPPPLPIRELHQGPMPGENIYLRPGHKDSDDRMFPDIAIGELRVSGDTLYVHLVNRGPAATPGQVMVVARAEANGANTGAVEVRTGRLSPGEARWVPLRGFSVKTAAATPAVFALESASSVAATARLMPSGVSLLDRSGQTRELVTKDLDESNNALTAAGSELKHGRP